MITQNAKKDAQNIVPKSDHFKLQHAPNTSLKVLHRCTLGSTQAQTFCVRFDPNDKYIATGCGDGSIKIFNVLTGKLSYVLNATMPEPMPTTSIRWRPISSPSVSKNVLITVNANGSVQHWHTTSGKLINTIYDEFNQLYCADYNPIGTQFATAGKDKVIRVYDQANKKLILQMAGGSGQPGHSNRVFSVRFDKDDQNILVSGGWDNTIQIWDLREGAPVRYIYGPYICGDGLDIMQGYIVSGSWRTQNQVQVWDIQTGALCDTIDFQMGFKSTDPCMVYSAQFRKGTGDLILAGGSQSNQARLFDRTNAYKPICTICDLSRACYNVDFSNKGDMFALGGGDGVVRCFNIQPAGFN